MTRKIAFASLLSLLLVLLTVSPVLAAKSYFAEHFDVQVDIQPGGDLLVTETIAFKFAGGPFTYVFREVSRNGTDDIQVLDAGMDGHALQPGQNAGQVEIVDGDPIKVTWHFDKRSDSTHIFVLRYRVIGAIRTGQSDALVWRAIPEQHSYSIQAASVALTYPLTVRPLQPPRLDHASTSAHLDRGFRLETGRLSEDESLTLTANFASGSLVSAPPAWQVKANADAAMLQQALPYGLGAAFLAGLAGLILVIFALRQFRRAAYIAPDPTQPVTVLPRDIAPALAGRLAGGGVPFLGTLFDLARRGVLGFEEGQKQWGSRTFNVILFHEDAALSAHEQVFVSSFFKKGSRVALSDIGHIAYSSKFTVALDEELTAAGLRDPQRSTQRNKMLVWTGLALALGMAVILAGLLLAALSLINIKWVTLLGAALIGAGFAAMLMGLVGLVAGLLVSTLSNEGERQAANWKSFCAYLRAITREKSSAIQPDLFDRYLPYAASFGIVSEWGKYFSKMTDVPVPAWLQGLGTSMDDGSFVALLAVITAADSSASAAAGGGDGGGASGGGSSGAG